jgi:hypothetical protein
MLMPRSDTFWRTSVSNICRFLAHKGSLEPHVIDDVDINRVGRLSIFQPVLSFRDATQPELSPRSKSITHFFLLVLAKSATSCRLLMNS